MDERHAVQLQAELDAPRAVVYRLFATAEGLATWLDGAELTAATGSRVRLRLADAVAVGTVLAVDPPQHLSIGFDWEGAPLGVATVLAFDAIDHGERTYVTLRHVGLPSPAEREKHAAVWRYWFERLVRAAERDRTGAS